LPTSPLIKGDTRFEAVVNFTSSWSKLYSIVNLESLLKGKPILGSKYNLSVLKGTELGVVDVWTKLMPARRFLPKNEGSSKASSVCFSILLVDKSNLTVWPLPRKFLSFTLNVATVPSDELYPAPIPRLPVGFSVSLTSIIIFSGAEPFRVLV